MTLAGSVVVLTALIVALARRAEPRLALLAAALALGVLAGKPFVAADAFARGMVAPMVAPICAAMAFAAVLSEAGCDRALVELLLKPLRRVGAAVLPGGMIAAFLLNAAIPSQASTAAAIGPVLAPLWLAAGYRPEIAAAALILGSSLGGDLLSPAAQDVLAVAGVSSLDAASIHQRILLPLLCGAAAAIAAFSLTHARSSLQRRVDPDSPAGEIVTPPGETRGLTHLLHALAVFVPIGLIVGARMNWAPAAWLTATATDGPIPPGTLTVVRALLIGIVVVLILSGRSAPRVFRAAFEGMGSAYGGIIGLTISAQCFGAGLQAAGVSGEIARAVAGAGPLGALVLSVLFPLSLALLSGSGSGPILTYAQTFLAPLPAGASTELVSQGVTAAAGACVAGAVGRTASPVAAVVIYSCGLLGVSPLLVLRSVLGPLAIGLVIVLGALLLLR